MIECEGLALGIALEHKLGQLFVLIHNYAPVFLRKCGRVIGRGNNGFHAQFRKAEIEHGAYIFKKIGVSVGKRAAHVIAFFAACIYKPLEFGYYLFPAAVAGIVHAEAVVYLLAPIKAQYNVAHFLIGKIYNVVVNKHAVRGKREAEVFVFFLFYAARIGYKLLHNIEIHQRLAAEEVHFKIVPRAGVFNKEVKRALADLVAHYGPFAMIFTLTCKAIGAAKVACMRNVQAQRLYNASRFGLQRTSHRLESIGRKKLARGLQLGYLVIALGNVLGGFVGIFFGYGGYNVRPVRRFKRGNHVVRHVIHGVHRAGAYIKHYIVTAKFILMDHILSFVLKMPPVIGRHS